MRVVLALVLLTPAFAQSAYVGSKVCAGCHSRIFASYSKTSMGRSAVLGNDPALASKLPVPARVFDSGANLYYEVFRKDNDLYQSQYQVGEDDKEIFRQTWKLDYVIGAGDNGFSFLLHRDGYLFEAPLSYYSKTRVWSFSPGYEQNNRAFTRPAVAECVGCHTGRPQPVAGKIAVYRDPPFTELAVGCENCHGPGGRHAAANGKAAIVNPKRLPGWLSDNICMKCHQGGDVRVIQPGKQDADFLPGTPLDHTVAIFKVPPPRDIPPQSMLLEHYFSMTLSKCYRASQGKLRCTSCHDPHSEPANLEARCVTCHQPADCRAAGTNSNCIGCHMPKRATTTIAHAVLTDHRIAIRPGELLPPLGDADLLHLTAALGEKESSVPEVTLLRAYAQLIHDGHPEMESKMEALLDRLSHGEPANPVLLAALARRAFRKNNPEAAIHYLSRAIRNGSTLPEDFLLLADLYTHGNQSQEALRTLRSGQRANPYVRELYEAIALHWVNQDNYAEASQEIRKAIELFPDDSTLRVLQNKVQATTLDGVNP